MQNFMQENWWSIVLVICVGAFYFLKFFTHSKAKLEVLKYLYAASKLAFATGDAKVLFVTQVAYAALPKYIKVFISSSVFDVIVASLYDELKDLVKELHDQADPVKSPTIALPTVQPPAQPEQAKPADQQAK